MKVHGVRGSGGDVDPKRTLNDPAEIRQVWRRHLQARRLQQSSPQNEFPGYGVRPQRRPRHRRELPLQRPRFGTHPFITHAAMWQPGAQRADEHPEAGLLQ
jgi:hypothetical protein